MAVANSNSVSVRIDIEVEDEDTTLSSSDSLCEVCYLFKPSKDFIQLSNCGHMFCAECVKKVFETNVSESKVILQCLRCSKNVSQQEIREIMDVEHYDKYLGFTLRRYLATRKPNVCYCLAPNCPYACINTCPDVTGSEERNHFVCGREECLSEHCNECKKAWHPGRTCEEQRREGLASPDGLTEELKKSMGTKNCPRCDAIIEKMYDGTCNQVNCSMCQTSFCWLCGKPVTEMHYMR